jgi:hypothetical protein
MNAELNRGEEYTLLNSTCLVHFALVVVNKMINLLTSTKEFHCLEKTVVEV